MIVVLVREKEKKTKMILMKLSRETGIRFPSSRIALKFQVDHSAIKMITSFPNVNSGEDSSPYFISACHERESHGVRSADSLCLAEPPESIAFCSGLGFVEFPVKIRRAAISPHRPLI